MSETSDELYPEWVVQRLMSHAPLGAEGIVTSNAIPVIGSGNILGARVATLSVNPSDAEYRHFNRSGKPLGPSRLPVIAQPFVDWPGDDIARRDAMTVETGRMLVDWFRGYFERGNYSSWFKQFPEPAFAATLPEFSYRSGSLCHLDVTQWATSPVWSKAVKQHPAACDLLLRADAGYLMRTLRGTSVRLVYVDGRAALDAVNTALRDAGTGVQLACVEVVEMPELPYRTTTAEIHHAALPKGDGMNEVVLIGTNRRLDRPFPTPLRDAVFHRVRVEATRLDLI